MRKLLVSVFSFILALMLSISSVSVTSAATSFKDVPSNHWAKKEIDYLVGKGVIKGYNDGTFKPNNNVTNAQVATMLVRALKLNIDGRPNPNFTDVFSTNPAFKEIATAVDVGIFPKGKTFSPNSPISREAMARALVNAFKLQGTSNVYFSDVPTSYWAYQYITRLAANNITTGYSDGTFKPKNKVTRAQFAAFVARALNDSFRSIILSEYIPKEWTIKYFKGEGNEYAEYTETILSKKDGLLETYIDNGGTRSVNILDVSNNEIALVYEESEVYEYGKIDLTKVDRNATREILLKNPIKVGETFNNWKVISTNEEIQVPYGKLKNVIVIEKMTKEQDGSVSKMTEYWAKGLGRVKEEYLYSYGDSEFIIKSELERVETYQK